MCAPHDVNCDVLSCHLWFAVMSTVMCCHISCDVLSCQHVCFSMSHFLWLYFLLIVVTFCDCTFYWLWSLFVIVLCKTEPNLIFSCHCKLQTLTLFQRMTAWHTWLPVSPAHPKTLTPQRNMWPSMNTSTEKRTCAKTRDSSSTPTPASTAWRKSPDLIWWNMKTSELGCSKSRIRLLVFETLQKTPNLYQEICCILDKYFCTLSSWRMGSQYLWQMFLSSVMVCHYVAGNVCENVSFILSLYVSTYNV